MDTLGLGQCYWTCLQGREDSYVRFISAYRPCVNKKGPNYVYNQQVIYLWDELNMVKPNPIKVFDNDGKKIVLGININDSVTKVS